MSISIAISTRMKRVITYCYYDHNSDHEDGRILLITIIPVVNHGQFTLNCTTPNCKSSLFWWITTDDDNSEQWTVINNTLQVQSIPLVWLWCCCQYHSSWNEEGLRNTSCKLLEFMALLTGSVRHMQQAESWSYSAVLLCVAHSEAKTSIAATTTGLEGFGA